jgi:hypothetical protein
MNEELTEDLKKFAGHVARTLKGKTVEWIGVTPDGTLKMSFLETSDTLEFSLPTHFMQYPTSD